MSMIQINYMVGKQGGKLITDGIATVRWCAILKPPFSWYCAILALAILGNYLWKNICVDHVEICCSINVALEEVWSDQRVITNHANPNSDLCFVVMDVICNI